MLGFRAANLERIVGTRRLLTPLSLRQRRCTGLASGSHDSGVGVDTLDKLARFALGTEDGAPALAEWRAATAALFAVEPLEEPFTAAIQTYSLGDMLFGASASVAHRFVRDAEVVARSGIDHLFFQLFIEGGFVGEAEGQPCVVNAGDIVIFDLAHRFETQATRFANLNLAVPRRLLPVDLRERHLHGLVLSPATSAGRMLASHLRSLWAVCEKAAADEAADIVRVTGATVAALIQQLGQSRRSGEHTAMIGQEIRDYIDANLSLRTLDAAHLCERFGLSRSALYRQFERVDGVAAYIRNRRLDAAFSELAALGRKSLRLDMLSRKIGFASEDSFARAFRNRYGFSPRMLRTRTTARGMDLPTQSAGTGASLGEWLRGIGGWSKNPGQALPSG